MPLCNKSMGFAKSGYEKGNAIMDKTPFLKSKTNKLIVWCVLGIALLLVLYVAFCGSNAEDALISCSNAIRAKDWLKYQECTYNNNPTHGGAAMSAKEKEEFATSEFCKAQMASDNLQQIGKWMANAKIVSVRKHGDTATIRFRPSDAKEWREMKKDGVLGLKVEVVKDNGVWKVDMGTLVPIEDK